MKDLPPNIISSTSLVLFLLQAEQENLLDEGSQMDGLCCMMHVANFGYTTTQYVDHESCHVYQYRRWS